MTAKNTIVKNVSTHKVSAVPVIKLRTVSSSRRRATTVPTGREAKKLIGRRCRCPYSLAPSSTSTRLVVCENRYVRSPPQHDLEDGDSQQADSEDIERR